MEVSTAQQVRRRAFAWPLLLFALFFLAASSNPCACPKAAAAERATSCAAQHDFQNLLQPSRVESTVRVESEPREEAAPLLETEHPSQLVVLTRAPKTSPPA